MRFKNNSITEFHTPDDLYIMVERDNSEYDWKFFLWDGGLDDNKHLKNLIDRYPECWAVDTWVDGDTLVNEYKLLTE